MNGLVLLLALLTAGGVLLGTEALIPRPPRQRLLAEDRRPLLTRLLEALFTPAAQRLSSIGGRRDPLARRHDLQVRLARAGYPAPFTTPESVLGYQLFAAALFAGLVGLFGLFLMAFAGVGPALILPTAGGAAALGWLMPLQTLKNAERVRKEQFMLDAAATLDRLAIYISAGYVLPAALTALAERPGGAWIGEFRRIAAYQAVNGNFPAALAYAEDANGRLPEVTGVLERFKSAYQLGGGGLAKTLRAMANDARIRIRLLLTERGYKNAVWMVVPAFFAIIAIALILVAPGAAMMLLALGG